MGLDINIGSCKIMSMAKFNAKLVKWGNSVGVSIPKPIRDSLGLEAGNDVEIRDIDNTIVINKGTTDRSLELARLAMKQKKQKRNEVA